MTAGGCGAPVAVVVGASPSAPYRDIFAAAADTGAPVLVEAAVLARYPGVVELAGLHGVAIEAIASGTPTAFADGARRRGAARLVAFDEAYAFDCLRANAIVAGVGWQPPGDKLEMRRLQAEEEASLLMER